MAAPNKNILTANVTGNVATPSFSLRGGRYVMRAAGTAGGGTVQLQWWSAEANSWNNIDIQNGQNLNITSAFNAVQAYTLNPGLFRINFFGSAGANAWLYFDEAEPVGGA